jgi:O-antigen/teichoic acid export membrane protein
MKLIENYINIFKQEIKRLRNSEFVKNVSTLMTGTALSQFVPVLISPILTRIYTPDDFGLLSVFLSYSMIISTMVTGKYEMAIMLPKSEKDAINLGGLATLLTVLFSSGFLILIILFRNSIAFIPGAEKINKWMILLPISFGLVAYGNILNYWLSRNKEFNILTKGKIFQTISSSGLNIGLGIFNPVPFFLILSNIISQSINSLYLTFVIIKNHRKLFQYLSLKQFKSNGKKYIKFPLYDIPNSLSYSISTQGMNLFFSKFFGDIILGYFSMVQRILITPFSFISLSFTQVFFEKMSDIYNNNPPEFNKYLRKAQDRLIIYLFVPFFLFVFLSRYIITFIFGMEWGEMYKYIFILSPMIFFNLTTSPYTYIFKIINKQEVALIINILRMILLISVVIIGNYLTKDPLMVFTMFSLTSNLITSLSITICSKYLNARLSTNFKVQISILILLNIVFYYLLQHSIL